MCKTCIDFEPGTFFCFFVFNFPPRPDENKLFHKLFTWNAKIFVSRHSLLPIFLGSSLFDLASSNINATVTILQNNYMLSSIYVAVPLILRFFFPFLLQNFIFSPAGGFR